LSAAVDRPKLVDQSKDIVHRNDRGCYRSPSLW
jgi:hypothetical protein